MIAVAPIFSSRRVDLPSTILASVYRQSHAIGPSCPPSLFALRSYVAARFYDYLDASITRRNATWVLEAAVRDSLDSRIWGYLGVMVYDQDVEARASGDISSRLRLDGKRHPSTSYSISASSSFIVKICHQLALFIHS